MLRTLLISIAMLGVLKATPKSTAFVDAEVKFSEQNKISTNLVSSDRSEVCYEVNIPVATVSSEIDYLESNQSNEDLEWCQWARVDTTNGNTLIGGNNPNGNGTLGFNFAHPSQPSWLGYWVWIVSVNGGYVIYYNINLNRYLSADSIVILYQIHGTPYGGHSGTRWFTEVNGNRWNSPDTLYSGDWTWWRWQTNLNWWNFNSSYNNFKIGLDSTSTSELAIKRIYIYVYGVAPGATSWQRAILLFNDSWRWGNEDTVYKFWHRYGYWAAVGLRPGTPGTDWDLEFYGCRFQNYRARSQGGDGYLDFVIGDWNHNQCPESCGVKAYFFSGVVEGYHIEYEDSTETLNVGSNGPYTWESSDDRYEVLEVFDVFLNGGITYRFDLSVSGSAPTGIALFNSNGDTYYAPRSDAEVDTQVLGGHAIFDYPTPNDDRFGIVIYAETSGTGTYYVNITPIVGIEENYSHIGLPNSYVLFDNKPNPVKSVTVFSFQLPNASPVLLDIYDVKGSLVKRLIDNRMRAGINMVTWDGRDQNGSFVREGIYFYRLEAGEFIAIKKMVKVE